jgi:hypothetical protein
LSHPNAPSRGVFLSYASQDATAAQRIADALRQAGIEVWLDQSELRGGEAWDASIRRQIKACRLFVAVISANTQAREEGYFRREWNLAVGRTLDMADDTAFLLPVVIDATRDADARVPEKFREVQWTRLPGGDTSPSFVERARAGRRRSCAGCSHHGSERAARRRHHSRAARAFTCACPSGYRSKGTPRRPQVRHSGPARAGCRCGADPALARHRACAQRPAPAGRRPDVEDVPQQPDHI